MGWCSTGSKEQRPRDLEGTESTEARIAAEARRHGGRHAGAAGRSAIEDLGSFGRPSERAALRSQAVH